MAEFIDIVFDGPPSAQSGRFVEVEDEYRTSVKIGTWIDRGNGMWALRIVDGEIAAIEGNTCRTERRGEGLTVGESESVPAKGEAA